MLVVNKRRIYPLGPTKQIIAASCLLGLQAAVAQDQEAPRLK